MRHGAQGGEGGERGLEGIKPYAVTLRQEVMLSFSLNSFSDVNGTHRLD